MVGGVCLLFLQDYSGHTQVSPQVTFWVCWNSPVQGPHLAGPTVHGEHAQTHFLYRPTVIGIVCSLFSFLFLFRFVFWEDSDCSSGICQNIPSSFMRNGVLATSYSCNTV